MSELDSTPSAQPEPPTKRRKVHEDSVDSTPQRFDTPNKADEKHSTRVSIMEKPLDSRSTSQSRSRSGSRSPSCERRQETDYYSSDRPSRSPSSSRTRSRSPRSSSPRSRTSSRSPTRRRSRSRTESGGSLSRSRSDLRSPSPLRDDRSKTPAARQPVVPHYVPRLLLTGHSRPVSQVRISPDGQWIASASADATIRIWEAATGAHMDTLVGHVAGVSAVAWAPDSQTLASGSDDKSIRLWDRVTGRPARVRPLLGHHNYVYCLAFSPKGNVLASGSYDEAVFLWDVRAGRQMRSLPAHSDPVSGIDFCRDGTLVVSCSTDGLTRIWDTATGQCLRTLVHEDNPPITSVCFAPNGRYVLAFSMDSCLRLWDYVSGTVRKTYQGHENSKFSIGGCFGTLTPTPADSNGNNDNDSNSNSNTGGNGNGEGAFIASPSEDGDIVLWDVKSKRVVQRLAGAHRGVCFWVDVCGDTMVSAGQDGRIKVYRHRAENNGSDSAAANSSKVNGVASRIRALDVNEPGADGASATPLKDEDVKMEE
ncbi:WD40 repeat-like protein [Hypoxylon sp. FL1284]|nr:WD40 repeat-like protein [Hypoxylon sp. FL1284]